MKWFLLLLLIESTIGCSTIKGKTVDSPIAAKPVLAEYTVPVDVTAITTSYYSINVVNHATPYY